MTKTKPSSLSPHELDCLKKKYQLKYRPKSVMQKNKIINQLIDEILELQENKEKYGEDCLESKKLEAKILAEMLLESIQPKVSSKEK